jgi:hypothetical protein
MCASSRKRPTRATQHGPHWLGARNSAGADSCVAAEAEQRVGNAVADNDVACFIADAV